MEKTSYPENLGRMIAGFFCCRWLATLMTVLLLDICTWLAFKDLSGAPSFGGGDKMLHILAFFVLSVAGHTSLSFDFFPKTRHPAWWILALSGLACMGYGFFIELVQMHLSHRSASSGDLVADLIGIVAGSLFVVILKLYPRSTKTR